MHDIRKNAQDRNKSNGQVSTAQKEQDLPEKEKRRIVLRGLRRIPKADYDCNIAALFDGDYSSRPGKREEAERIIVFILRQWFEEIHGRWAVEMALEELTNRSFLTTYGPRKWSEDLTFRRELLHGGETEPHEYRTLSERRKEINRKQKQSTREKIRIVVTGSAGIWKSHEKAELYFHPEDVAEEVGVTKKTAIRHMREMQITTEMKDPAHQGRGRPAIVFEYESEEEFQEVSYDSPDVVVSSGPGPAPRPTHGTERSQKTPKTKTQTATDS